MNFIKSIVVGSVLLTLSSALANNQKNNFNLNVSSNESVEAAKRARPLALSYIEAGFRAQTSGYFKAMWPALQVSFVFNGWDAICHAEDGTYGGTVAYVIPTVGIFICDAFLDLDESGRAQTLVHESAHLVGVLFECSAENIERLAMEAAHVPRMHSGYEEACARGEEPLLSRAAKLIGAVP